MNKSNRTRVSSKYLLLMLSFFLSDPIATNACSTFIAGKNATSNGAIIIARTSDTIDARRAKNIQIYFDANRSKSYIGLPYWDLEADQSNDMAQVATNKYGLSISATETIQNSPEVMLLDPFSRSPFAMHEPNIPAALMPYAQNASNAVDILGSLIEEYGIKAGFGVLLADQDEAWYLETLSGHQWVAIKIPEDVYFVAANGPGQIQNYSPIQYTYKFSYYKGRTPIEFALQNGIAQINRDTQEFDFRKTYAHINSSSNANMNYVRLAYMQHRFNPSSQPFTAAKITSGNFPMFLKPERKITVADVQQLLASHYEDFPDFDPYIRYNKDQEQRVFYYPIANLRTSNAHVTVVGSRLDYEDSAIANVEYIALGMPTISFYLPIYYGISYKPPQLTGAINRANDEKLFWQFRELQVFVFLYDPQNNIDFDFKKRSKIVRDRYKALALEIEQDSQQMKAYYASTRDKTFIDEFTRNSIDKLSKLNHELIQYFMETLDINKKYGLTNEQDRSQWFTDKVREQDCNYRNDHCRSGFTSALGGNPWLDEPIL